MNIKAPLVALLAAASLGSASAQEITFKATEVADGLVMLEGVGGFAGGNLLLWTGEDATVLIDDAMPNVYEAMRTAIAEHVDTPVDFVINTHVHGDHIGNNARLSRDGATILAHDNIRQRLVADGITGPNGKQPAGKHDLPSVTFAEEVTLHLNGHSARVIHVSTAHTDGDAIIYFPEADVLHTGDAMFNGLYPFIDLDSGGDVDGYLAAQEKILSLAGKDTKIVPGHGPLAGKADLEAARDMLMEARDRVRKLKAEGKSEDEIVAANPLADYDADWTWGFIDTERMTRTLARD